MTTPLSTTIILKALDCLSARAEVAAQNIANAGTPGYRPLRVTFENALIDAASQGKAAVQSVQAKIMRDTSVETASGTRIDLELATQSSTAMRYAALVEILSRRMQSEASELSGNG